MQEDGSHGLQSVGVHCRVIRASSLLTQLFWSSLSDEASFVHERAGRVDSYEKCFHVL